MLGPLLEENALQDTTVTFRAKSAKMSSFVLSLLSPVLRAMVCGTFKEGTSKMICLDDVLELRFSLLVRLACGEEELVAEGISALLDIGELAERLQMEAVRDYIEDVLVKELTEGNCVELFTRSDATGLKRLRIECSEVLGDEFMEVSQKEGFKGLSEEIMGYLLDQDCLWVDAEEMVFEALLNWMQSSGELLRGELLRGELLRGELLRGECLLTKVRYGLFDDTYLAYVLSTFCANRTLRMLVGEALVKKGAPAEDGIWDGVERLCDKWITPRKQRKEAAAAPTLNLPVGTIFGADVLRKPYYVAIDWEGHLLVSDFELHQVIVFNSDGSVARRLGSYGSAVGQLNGPTGIAVDRQGRMVVADYYNDRIQVWNEDGSVAWFFGSKGTAAGQLNHPIGVAIDSAGHIIVADSENHRIQVFNANGSFLRKFGSQGTAIGQLDNPWDVAVDRVGRIVVADSRNHRVQVFNSNGSVAMCFGSRGDGLGQFQYPDGVAVDREGRFIVADTFNDRVQVFNPDWSLERVIGTAGGGVGQLARPHGIALDGTGLIVIAEGVNNHRVQAL